MKNNWANAPAILSACIEAYPIISHDITRRQAEKIPTIGIPHGTSECKLLTAF